MLEVQGGESVHRGRRGCSSCVTGSGDLVNTRDLKSDDANMVTPAADREECYTIWSGAGTLTWLLLT